MKGISFSKILWYAQRASAAYQNEMFIRKHFAQTVHVHHLESIDVQYFIEYYPEENLQVISIRGTANLANAFEDMEYSQAHDRVLSIYVHRGFDHDAFAVYQHILPHLKSHTKIRLTGHSLGAAISTLLMMYLHNDGFEIEQSVNFGQPKITNAQGAEKSHSLPLTRIVDDNDIVPLLPPITLLDSIHGIYKHFGDEIILLKNKKYHYLQEHSAERKSVGSFWCELGHESIKDHFIENYITNIKCKLGAAIEVPLA